MLFALILCLLTAFAAPVAAQETGTTDDGATAPADDGAVDDGAGVSDEGTQSDEGTPSDEGAVSDDGTAPTDDGTSTSPETDTTGGETPDGSGQDPDALDDGTGVPPLDSDTEGTTLLPPCPTVDDTTVDAADGDGPPAESPSTDPAPDGQPETANGEAPAPDGCTNLPVEDLPLPEGDDELSGEAPAERPDGEEGDGWTQQPFQPTVVIQDLVDAAQAKVDEAREERVEHIARVRVLRRRIKELEAQRDALDVAERTAAVELGEVTDRLQLRATMAFVVGDNSRLGVATSNEEALRADAQAHVVEQIVDDELALIDDYRELRASLSDDALDVVARLGIVEDLLDAALADIDDVDLRIQDLELEVLAFSNGAQSFISGIRFPIGGTYSVPLIDSWGFPRMMGTSDEHWHEGIDIFAPLGSELVATESGTITNVGVGRLGGLKFWLTGDSGTKWYYAHLSDFAPGLAVGQRVQAGDVLGYVGNTGNALGTPYHLHLQMHPDGGDPANPYPILKAASDWERTARASAGLPEIPE